MSAGALITMFTTSDPKKSLEAVYKLKTECDHLCWHILNWKQCKENMFIVELLCAFTEFDWHMTSGVLGQSSVLVLTQPSTSLHTLLLLTRLQMTSSFAAVIFTTATRGHPLIRSVNEGHTKLLHRRPMWFLSLTNWLICPHFFYCYPVWCFSSLFCKSFFLSDSFQGNKGTVGSVKWSVLCLFSCCERVKTLPCVVFHVLG